MPNRRQGKRRGHVIAIGGANMDLKCRIAGGAVMGTSNPGTIALASGGVARNLAETLARLGVSAKLIAAIGRDPLGDELLAATRAAGVDVRAVLRGRFATGAYAATLNRRGEMVVAVSAMDAVARLTPAVLGRRRSLLRGARLILADCNLPPETLDWLVAFAAQAGVELALETVSVPKARRLKAILRCGRPLFALFTNRAELGAILGQRLRGRRALAAAARRLHDLGVRHLAVGLGTAGMFVSSAESGARLVSGRRGRVADVTGGGDGAVAGTIFGLLRGCALPEAARYGQAVAALTVASERSVSPEISPRRLLRTVGAGTRRGR